MISAGVAVEGHHGHGHGHGLGLPGPQPYIPTVAAYPPPPQDWRKHQEFLRPAPKHTNNNTRYNGSTTSLNGTRLKYPSPVNLSQSHQSHQSLQSHQGGSSVPQVKDESLPPPPPHSHSAHSSAAAEELASYYPRLYPPPTFTGIYSGPYAGLYSGPYTPLVRAATAAAAAAAAGYAAPPPLSPLEHQYSPPASTPSPHAPSPHAVSSATGGPTGQGTFVSPATTQFSAPATRKDLASRERDRDRERDKRQVVQGFKVPSGKEGSLKHRILTRPSDLPLPLPPSLQSSLSSQLSSFPSPLRKHPHTKHQPHTITSASTNNNNTVLPGNFTKGSLIQLATGELRRVEDMRTEDFVLSAERSPELRLAESTVLRVCENQQSHTAMITLTYNQNRTQVEFEATQEHPFFVYGQGWASCSPERTLQYYGLKVHRLQVGDILVSLTPREPGANNNNTSNSSGSASYDLSRGRESATVVTTATTTAMTARQVSRPCVSTSASSSMPPPASTSISTSSSTNSSSSGSHGDVNSASNSRKRRWSAPDQICDEHEQVARRAKE